VASHIEEYFPRPSEYIPERWLPDKEYDHLRARHPFAYMPFGYGPRMCVGRRFAELEIEILLAKVGRKVLKLKKNNNMKKFKLLSSA